MKIQVPQSINILALITADLPSLDAMLSELGAGTIDRAATWALDQALNFHETHNRGIGRSSAKGRFLLDQHGQVVRVQLVAPVGMLQLAVHAPSHSRRDARHDRNGFCVAMPAQDPSSRYGLYKTSARQSTDQIEPVAR